MSRQARQTSRGAGTLPRAFAWNATAALLLAAGGCANDLDTRYGGTSGRYQSTSVNGVDVLGGMFEDTGRNVLVRRMLITSSMERVQTIVWFPDDLRAPGAEVCDWFDRWLASGNGRTLVYVGRNYDAAPSYWRAMESRVEGDQQRYYRGRVWEQELFEKPPVAGERMTCEWFTIQRRVGQRAEKLGGPWASGINPSQAEVYVSDEFTSPYPSRRLLTADGRAIVSRLRNPAWQGGELITVSNGSFLLNMPLVNHENRKLAGKLIRAVAAEGPVVFLESGRGGPPIDPPAPPSALAQLFAAWPLNAILLHLAVLGIIFCFARWPIFGAAKVPPAATTSNFAHHVEAVGALLARSGDRAYAISKLPDDTETAKAAPSPGRT